MKNLDRAWVWAILTAGWMGLIYALSDRPTNAYEGADKATSWLPFATTIAHVGLYFVLSAFVLRPLVLLKPVTEVRIAYSTVFIALVYGIFDEVHQSSVEGRASEVVDVIADVFGAVLVVVLWFLIRRYKSNSDE